jgi:hypothetical protein
MSSGHIIPGWEPTEPDRDGSPVGRAPPEPTHAERARTLVASQTRGTLSTIALKPAGTPFGSVVTFSLDDKGRPNFFVSTMAEHTHNLGADARASLLVVEDTPLGADPLASGHLARRRPLRLRGHRRHRRGPPGRVADRLPDPAGCSGWGAAGAGGDAARRPLQQ